MMSSKLNTFFSKTSQKSDFNIILTNKLKKPTKPKKWAVGRGYYIKEGTMLKRKVRGTMLKTLLY